MASSPDLTFDYRFSVQTAQRIRPSSSTWARSLDLDCSTECFCWAGDGSGRATFGKSEGLAGPHPRFELFCGWLTICPTERWTHALPLRAFSDAGPPPSREEGLRQFEADRKEALALAQQMGGGFDLEKLKKATEMVERRNGRVRDLASFSLFIGEALEQFLQKGDELQFRRDGNGDFRYSVRRGAETIFSAGSPTGCDDGGVAAVWQQHDEYANSNVEQLIQQNIGLRVAETVSIHRPYITARIRDQFFLLLDGDHAEFDPYCVYLARSNQNVPAIAFEFWPRAVHACGRLDYLDKNLIRDAAQQLIAPRIKILSTRF